MLTNYPMYQDFEILALELELSKTNVLIIGTYKVILHLHQKLKLSWHSINQLVKISHEFILLMGDFRMILDNPNFNELIEDHELSALLSEPTCFKSINIRWQLSNKQKNSFYEYSNTWNRCIRSPEIYRNDAKIYICVR